MKNMKRSERRYARQVRMAKAIQLVGEAKASRKVDNMRSCSCFLCQRGPSKADLIQKELSR